MSVTRYCNPRSPKLQAVIVEYTLQLLRVKQYTVNDLFNEIESTTHLSHNRLGKHLVYLIEYELITYNGQRKLLRIEEDGIILLDKINKEKEMQMIDSEDLTITIEKDMEPE